MCIFISLPYFLSPSLSCLLLPKARLQKNTSNHLPVRLATLYFMHKCHGHSLKKSSSSKVTFSHFAQRPQCRNRMPNKQENRHIYRHFWSWIVICVTWRNSHWWQLHAFHQTQLLSTRSPVVSGAYCSYRAIRLLRSDTSDTMQSGLMRFMRTGEQAEWQQCGLRDDLHL